MKSESIKQAAILNVLLSFITNGADMVEFFGNIDEDRMSQDTALVYTILGIAL